MITLGLGNIVPRREPSSTVSKALLETVEQHEPSSAVLIVSQFELWEVFNLIILLRGDLKCQIEA